MLAFDLTVFSDIQASQLVFPAYTQDTRLLQNVEKQEHR
jgi:hypothetical protein